jgi:hypothetical protein
MGDGTGWNCWPPFPFPHLPQFVQLGIQLPAQLARFGQTLLGRGHSIGELVAALLGLGQFRLLFSQFSPKSGFIGDVEYGISPGQPVQLPAHPPLPVFSQLLDQLLFVGLRLCPGQFGTQSLLQSSPRTLRPLDLRQSSLRFGQCSGKFRLQIQNIP